jgi:hypothetical protein
MFALAIAFGPDNFETPATASVLDADHCAWFNAPMKTRKARADVGNIVRFAFLDEDMPLRIKRPNSDVMAGTFAFFATQIHILFMLLR